MGKLYAKITLADGSVTQISDEFIQIMDDERGVYECVEIDEEPRDGLHLGDIVKHKSGQHFKDITFKDSIRFKDRA